MTPEEILALLEAESSYALTVPETATRVARTAIEAYRNLREAHALMWVYGVPGAVCPLDGPWTVCQRDLQAGYGHSGHRFGHSETGWRYSRDGQASTTFGPYPTFADMCDKHPNLNMQTIHPSLVPPKITAEDWERLREEGRALAQAAHKVMAPGRDFSNERDRRW